MYMVRDFYERLQFSKTGIIATVNGPLKPGSRRLSPGIKTTAAEDVGISVLQTRQAVNYEKQYGRKKIDNVLETLNDLRLDNDK